MSNRLLSKVTKQCRVCSRTLTQRSPKQNGIVVTRLPQPTQAAADLELSHQAAAPLAKRLSPARLARQALLDSRAPLGSRAPLDSPPPLGKQRNPVLSARPRNRHLAQTQVLPLDLDSLPLEAVKSPQLRLEEVCRLHLAAQ